MSRPAFELAGIFRQHGDAYRKAHNLPLQQLRVMRAIEVCRTAALGGHVEKCSQCDLTRIAYNSCRNRHCPKCQNAERAHWLESRKAELLPVEFSRRLHHSRTDGSHRLLQQGCGLQHSLSRRFGNAAHHCARPQTLGAEIGFFAILHTWGQNLLHHPHVHCVVPGGGLGPDHDRWIDCKPGFFLPVRVLSRLFRRLFLEALADAFYQGKPCFFGETESLREAIAFAACLVSQENRECVVYSKPPFGGPGQVLEYLGRYTHRVALSNERILGVSNGEVTFQWKYYRHKDKQKSRVMTLPADEFIRRFLIHALPPGFPRVRHFGFLANRHRREKLTLCRRLLTTAITGLLPSIEQCRQFEKVLVSPQPARCPGCGGPMIRLGPIPAYLWPNRPPDSS